MGPYKPMGDPLLVEAYLNRQDWQLLGEPVHPLCLADILNFAITGNPILEGAELTGELLVNAVLILSHPVSPFGGFWVDTAKRNRLIERLAQSDLSLEAKKLRTYVKDYWDPVELSHLLEVEQDEGTVEPTRPRNIPWVLYYATVLTCNTNFTEDQIWSMPLGQVMYRTALIEAYKSYKCRLRNPEERKNSITQAAAEGPSFEELYRRAYERAQELADQSHGKV